jgi:3-methyladenine DNA glycosylase Tag
MKDFEEIYERAAERKGGEEALKALLPDTIVETAVLKKLPEDRYLSAMSKAIFKAGFVWRVVDNKWPGFEDAFWQFNPWRCAYMSPEEHEAILANAAIIRNDQKIQTVPVNALMILDVVEQYGSFGEFIANWSSEDYIGLLAYLKQHGSRLGGMTCQYFLRSVGKDGFILGRDGIAALIDAGVIDKNPTSKSALKKVQDAYNQWQQGSGFNLAQISRVLALSIDS